MLARLMLRPADLLVLDEPTNDLDIPTLEVLEESLLEFSGALVLVTHDRYLMDRVATEIMALDGRGGAERYAEYSQWEANRRGSDKPRKRKSEAKPAAGKPKRLAYLEQREWAGMEAAVQAAEEGLAKAEVRAADPGIATDAVALEARHADVEAARKKVDRLYARWAELEEKRQ